MSTRATLPTIATPRLVLRPFALDDGPRVQELAAAREVAVGTLSIPHPYEPGMAEAWIATHEEGWANGSVLPLAMTTSADGLVGAIGLQLALDHRRAELGYWVGLPYWGRGYATEAATALVDWAFPALDLHLVVARHFTRNAASGRVMQKLGMRHEGTMREHVLRFGRFEDLECYALLASEWRIPV